MNMSILVRATERQIDNERRGLANSRDACADCPSRLSAKLPGLIRSQQFGV